MEAKEGQVELRRKKGEGKMPGGSWGKGKAQASAGSLVLRVLQTEFIDPDGNNTEYLPKKKLSR